jgi:Flp pilus assembly pilin Flp
MARRHQVNRIENMGRVVIFGIRGQGLAEYALLLALIAIMAVAALVFVGGSITSVLSTIGKKL